MKLRDILEEVTREQMHQRQYDDGYDAGMIDVRSGHRNRFLGRIPQTRYEHGYLKGYKSLETKKAKRDDMHHDDMPLVAA